MRAFTLEPLVLKEHGCIFTDAQADPVKFAVDPTR